ncbi:hypothetical protein N7456_004380 [Penicillium angulare]|uniref:Uncharacterized protein n=1 Tax=Penicillium angulare TaxID=116970 RepID=A0A9W9FXA1_9EURO|nr:hypothetical protein N7456_004380 [Penicillium angulare]
MALPLGPFGSRARVKWQGVVHMPDVSFYDVASPPMGFGTAYVSLGDVTDLHRGQSVLIHAATRGVGQTVIRLPRDYMGAEIYVTVGSDVLAPFENIVEIGKRDLGGDSLLEIGTISRDASFTSIDMMGIL